MFLGLGLATISKHMADLETRLGMRLCARGHEEFRLTEQGELVYRATLEVFDRSSICASRSAARVRN